MKANALLVLLVLVVSASCFAQPPDARVLGVQLDAGYTAIDLPTALDWNSDYFDSWDQFFGAIKVQYTFARLGKARVGAELGANRLYYYYVRVPNPPFSARIYERDVWAWDGSAILALDVSPQFEVQGGAGLYIFHDGTTVGFRGAALYRIPVAPQFVVPIGASVDVIFGDGTPIGAGVAAGVEYRPSGS